MMGSLFDLVEGCEKLKYALRFFNAPKGYRRMKQESL